jgi:hypothetical protein
MGPTSGTRTANPSGAPGFTPGFGLIKIRKPRKNRQYNDQKQDKNTNNDVQNTTQIANVYNCKEIFLFC